MDATARDIITRALVRLRRLPLGTVANDDIAQHALDTLNTLIFRWASNGVDVKHQPFTLDSLFTFFVPPAGLAYQTIVAMNYKGTWDASTNTPALASGTGTQGDFYRVSANGTSTLDGVSSWQAGDYLIFEQISNKSIQKWKKAEDSQHHHEGVVAMLATRLAPDFGTTARPEIVDDARKTMSSLRAAYLPPDDLKYDSALIQLSSRRWPYPAVSTSGGN